MGKSKKITKMNRLILASGNAHKIQEFNQILAPDFNVIGLKDLDMAVDIAETGMTFAENADIKASYLFNRLQEASLGEDSGLEVIALDLKPGIYTARYAGDHKNDDDNIDLLLQNLAHKNDRRAQFKTVIAYVDDHGHHIFEGVCKGKIAIERMGENGFGYDPIFIPDGYSESFAQLPTEVKNAISHRAKAIAKLKAYLETKEKAQQT